MSERQEWQMWTLGVNRLYLSLSGSLTAPYYTPHIEAAAAWLYLYAPRLQSLDWDLLARLGAGPLYVLLFVLLALFKRGDMMWRAEFDRAIAAATDLYNRMVIAKDEKYADMVMAKDSRYGDMVIQYEARLKEERDEKVMWKEAWAKAQGLAVQGLHLAQSKDP
jgi:hypothetical protein